jgi:hypothetical protein
MIVCQSAYDIVRCQDMVMSLVLIVCAFIAGVWFYHTEIVQCKDER